MSMRRAVITGIGVVSPAGAGREEYFKNLLAGRSFIREIDRFDSSRYTSRHAGMVGDFGAEELFSKRLLKKLDLFSQMTLVASEQALVDAGLSLEREDRERVGIVLGNALGGWGFAEEELRDLYRAGVREVSPYQATAWFPAAPQGQVSIHYGIRGFAKTIISDIASSHLALDYAARAIALGRADIVLAGGTEAPVSPYALLCCNTSGELSGSGRYRPFDRGRDGYVLAEGAAVLIVEELGRARARGAKALAEIKGFGHASDGLDPRRPDPEGRGMERAMRMALERAGLTSMEIGYIMPAGMGGSISDAAEAKAINSIFGGAAVKPAVGVPRALYGNALGASGALDAAAACVAMEKGAAPVLHGVDADEGCGWMAGDVCSAEKEINNVMINSTGRGGVHASLILGLPA